MWRKRLLHQGDASKDCLAVFKADENGNWKAENIDFKGKAYFDQGYEIKVASSVDEAGNVADLSTPTTFYFPVPTPPEDHL